MALGTGICAGKIVAGVLGMGAASVLGFNWITTGCPTGVCPTERAAQAAVIPASLTTGQAGAEAGVDSCCALMGAEAKVETVAAITEACATEAASCCSEKQAEAAVTSVALTTEAGATAEACCFDKGAAAPCDEAKPCCQENFGLADSAAKP